jgi:hypothetical protein
MSNLPAPARRLRRREAASYIGVSEGFLEKAAVRGDGPPYVRVSARLVVYEVADLDAWMAARRVQSTAEAPSYIRPVSASRCASPQSELDRPGSEVPTQRES